MPKIRLFPLFAALVASTVALAAAPTAITSGTSSVTASSAQLNGQTNPGGESTTGWFRLDTVSPGTCNDTFGTRVPASGGTMVGAGTATVPYSVSAAGLAPGTTYFFCAITSNASGTAFGSVLQFTTPALAPTMVTQAASAVTSFSATLNGTGNPNGSGTTAFFRYGTANPGSSCSTTYGTRFPVTGGSDLGNGNGAQPFSQNVTGLLAGVTYYFCAFGTNSLGTVSGNTLQLTTLVAVPAVTTTAPNISGTSVTLNGTVNPNGASTSGWFRYQSSDPGACNDAFGTRIPASGGVNMGNGSTPVSLSQAVTLSPGTTYYYCAIAQNSEGTTLGNIQSFTTPAIPTVTTSAVSGLLSTSVTLNGSANPNSGSTSTVSNAWFRYSETNPGTCSDAFGFRAPSSGIATNGSGSGNSSFSFSQAVSGLLPGTTYYYCAISQNVVGTGFGTLQTFTTPPALPITTTFAASNITGSTATLNGQANPRGASTSGWFRYSTASPGTCNDTFGTRAPGSGGTTVGADNTTTPFAENITGLSPGTTYYFCAIANNSVGTTFGSVTAFTTPDVPTVTTVAASSISGTSAQLNGTADPNLAATTAYFRYATVNPGSCNDSFGTRFPASGGSNMGNGSTALSYSQTPVTLTAGTTYFFCAIATNAVGTGFGSVLSFTTPGLPTVTTAAASPVTATSATLNGNANPNGAFTQTWFRYWTADPGTCSDSGGTRAPVSSFSFAGSGSGTANFSFGQLTSTLTPGQSYWYCAIAQNTVGTTFGNVVQFTAPPLAPSVGTSSVTLLTGSTVTLNGSANPNGAATTGWFRYSTASPGTCNDTFGTRAPGAGGTNFPQGNSAVAYSEPLSGLTPGTTYFYCAIANNSAGTGFGSVLQFTTPDLPAVTTVAASQLFGSSAQLNGTADPNGAATTAWFRYSTVNPGTCDDSFGTRFPATGGTNMGSGSSPLSFSWTPTTLTPGTTYFFCAIANNLVGTGFGSVLSFTAPNTPTVTTEAVTLLTPTSVTFNGTANPNGATATGYFRYSTTNPVSCNDSFGTRWPSSGGAGSGSGNSVFNFSQPLSGLLPGTQYWVCAIGNNVVGTGFGTPLTFTTPAAPPTVTTTGATLVTATSATLNGSVNPRGADATGWFRYSTSNPGSCSDGFGFRIPATGGTAFPASNSSSGYGQALTGLALATTYYYCAIASSSAGTSFGAVSSFTTEPLPPTVVTQAATGVTTTAASLNATVTPNGAATTAYWRYSTTNPGTCSDTFGTRAPLGAGTGNSIGAGTSAVPTSITPTTLTPGATYYFCAIAFNSAGTTFGAVLSFKTNSLPPTLSTLAASPVGGTTATLNASGNPNGDSTSGWFRYSTVNPGSCNDTFGTRTPASGGDDLGSGTGAVAFSEALTGLTPGTQYFFCAIAQNSLGTTLGNMQSFTTPQAPLVTSNAATPVTATTATLNGTANPNGNPTTAWFRWSATSPGACNDTFGTRQPATGNAGSGSGTVSFNFAQALSSLQPGTTYYFCAIANNTVGTSFGALLSFVTPPAAPQVATSPASPVGTTTATVNASANPNGAATTGWFRYATVNPGSCNDSFGTRAPATGGSNLGAGTTVASFSEALTGLSPNTTYFYCPIAQNGIGTSFGGVSSFTTSGPPTTTSGSATGVGTATATLNGSAIPNGAQTTGYFRYATVSPGSCNDTFGTRAPATGGTDVGSGTTSQAFSESVTGLTNGTTYFFCAISSNANGTTFGAVNQFTTTNAPSAVTLAATSITTSTATLQGSTNPNGQSTTAYFRYSATPFTVCSDFAGTRAPVSGLVIGSGTAPVAHSAAISGLFSGTTYYYCAIGTNAAGTTYGNVMTFNTVGAPTVVTQPATAITTMGATLNGTGTPNGSATTGWFRYWSVNPGACSDTSTSSIRVPASGGTALGSGSTPANYAQTVTLSPGTTWWYCAIASNSSGTRLGTLLSFTTPTGPTTTTLAASAVTGTTATLNGSANPRNDATTAWFRYSTVNPVTCNDTFGTRAPASGGTAIPAGNVAVPYSENITGLTAGTTYWVCAIAQNSISMTFGTPLSFTTPTAPTVTTSAASSITAASAILNGSGDPNNGATTGYFRYDTTNPGSCNDTFGTRAPATGGVNLGSGTNPVPYTQTITGLTGATTYFFCAIVNSSEGTAFGSVLQFTTPTTPSVTTSPVTNVLSTTATFNASVNPNGLTTGVWFRFSTVDPGSSCVDSTTTGARLPATGTLAAGAGNSAVTVSQNATALTSGTTYYVCAFASNTVGASAGTPVSFTTTGQPVVTTVAQTGVTSSGATLNGSANPRGAAATGYFRYSSTNPVSCNDTFGIRAPATGGTALGSGSSAVTYSETLTNLAPATTYYYCAIANNSVGTGLGGVMSFTTTAGPAVATSAPSGVTGTTATLNGSANPRGAQTTGWFRYGTSLITVCNDTFGTRAPLSGGTDLGAGNSAAGYSQSLTGLTPGTTYYVCAIAQNAAGTSFGSVVTFVTPGPPSVTSSAATAISASGATLNGSATANTLNTTAWFRYSATNPGTCDDTFGTRTPASGGSLLGNGSTPVSYSQPVTGLTQGTTYYFCAIAQNSAGTAFGAVLSFTIPQGPAVTTLAATAVVGTSATLNGSANPNGGAATGWFRFSTVNPVSCNDTFGTRTPATGGTNLGAGTSVVAYSAPLTGLTPGSTYYFCAIAQNAVGVAFGTPLSFTVPATAPTAVSTLAPTGISGAGATLNGSANPGGATASGYFRYATVSPGTCNDTFGTRAPAAGSTNLGAGNAVVTFSQAVSGLLPSTTYYFCAIASNAAGTSFGNVLSFATPGAPTVTTTPATLVAAASATLNGSATPNAALTTGYFRYSMTNPGTCDDTFGTRAPASGGSNLGAAGTPVAFSQGLSGLTQGTTYYYCAIATNAVGTAFGTVLEFKTPSAPTVMTSSASQVAANTATLNGGANPNGTATQGWFRFSATNPGANCNDTFGTRVPATGGTQLGAGTATASFAQPISGLMPGVTYYFCAIAQNQVGTSFGQVLAFTSLAPAPSVTTLPQSDLTARAATLNGSANPNGTAAQGWFRYDTAKPVDCNDTFGTRVPAMGGMSLGMGNAAAPYSLALTGLKPNTSYYYCALASNLGGAGVGMVLEFKTQAIAPTVRTLQATNENGTTTLQGSGNANGTETAAWFQYGPTNPVICHSGFGTRLDATPSSLGSGDTEVAFSASAAPLPTGRYYYCAAVQSAAGQAFGEPLLVEVTSGGGGAGGCGCATGTELSSLVLLALALFLLRSRRAALPARQG